ncbi:MAG: pitrilysin family protein [Verrucomicrobiota bacterium]
MKTPAETAPSTNISFPPNTAQKWTLPNGLTVIVQEDRSAPVASVQAWCATGSIHEDKLMGTGVSHILEHMLFKGTATRSTGEIAQRIQDVGGYINAYTSFDRTVFWIDVPRSGVPTAIEILADAMSNSTLPEKEYVKEQEVIRREFAMGQDDPDRVVSQLLFATAYQIHPYRLPVIGLLDIYNQLTQPQVLEYYKTRYAPNNLTFVVVGDVEAGEVRSRIEELFGSKPARSLPPIYIPPEPKQLGRREVHQEFATELTHFAMAWHVPEITNPDVPALDVFTIILGEGRSSRLYRKVREELGLAYSIGAFSYTPGEPGLLGIDAILSPENRAALQEFLLQMTADIREHGVTPSELEKAKKIAFAHELGSLTTMRGQASDMGTNWFLTRNLNFSRAYLEKMQQVTLADVQRVAAHYLTEDNLTIVSLNPRGSLALANGSAKAADAGEIQRFELSNGLRILVREDARLPLIAAAAVFRCGLLAETPGTSGITRLTAKTLLKGTTTRNAEEISTLIENVGGAIGAEGGNNSLALRMEVTAPDLALGIDLLADVLLHATMPSPEVEREKEVQLARIKEQEEEPTSVARNLVRETLFPDHPFALRREGTPQSIRGLTSENLRAFRDRYLVARNGVIAIFGNVRAVEVKALLEEKLSGMPAGEPALQDAPQPPHLRRNRVIEETREKTQAVLMVGFRGVDIFDPDHFALQLVDEACSDLGSRFFIRIREEMGLAYFVGAGQVQALVPGLFAFYLGTDPAKVELVKAAFLDELDKLGRDGLTAVEVERAKKKLIGAQQIQNQSNDMFAYMAALDELYGLGFDYYKQLEPKVNALSVSDIKRVTRRFFAEQSYVLALVRPPAEK